MLLNEIKKDLYTLVKKDIGFEIYHYNDYCIKFSFYNLNSCYNAFAIVHLTEDDIPYIEWQYVRQNKTIEKIVIRLLKNMKKYTLKYGIETVLNEVEYYNNLSNNIFENKYSTDIEYHTFY